MKKLLSVILAVSFMLSAFCGVFAAEEETLHFDAEQEMQTGGYLGNRDLPFDKSKIVNSSKGINLFSNETEDVYEFLERQLRARAETITFYPTYKLEFSVYYVEEENEYYADLYEFLDVFRYVIFNNYDILVSPNFNDWYYEEEEDGKLYVDSFKPIYLNTREGDAAAIRMMDGEIAKYLAAAAQIPNDDVVGKLLVIHDLFCKNNTYATEELAEVDNKTASHPEIYMAYGLFRNKRAVCQGNSLALKAIYDALNDQLKAERGTSEDIIQTSFCASDALIHIWNVVKIDGEWYHIDETWDDPSYCDTGYARHHYFLRSERQMSDHIADGIFDWEYYADEDVVCYDEKYSGRYIFNSIPEGPYDEEGNFLGFYNNTGHFVSYEGGRYKSEVEFVGNDYPFWTENIIATKVLATDPIDYIDSNTGLPYCYVVFFSLDYVDMDFYQVNGNMTGCQKGWMQRQGIFDYDFAKTNVPQKVFFWERDGMEPLCRVIDIASAQ